MVDFLVIQSARLVEQIVLKQQLTEGRVPSFRPSSNSFFYNKRLSTGKILKKLRKLLPFSSSDSVKTDEVSRINLLANLMIDLAFQFLDCRNPIVHHIGNPEKELNDIIRLSNQANGKYKKFLKAHSEFMIAAQPYCFSEKDLQYFNSIA